MYKKISDNIYSVFFMWSKVFGHLTNDKNNNYNINRLKYPLNTELAKKLRESYLVLIFSQSVWF